jgi:hypothetical protein
MKAYVQRPLEVCHGGAHVLWYAHEQKGFFDGFSAGYKEGAADTKLSFARLMVVFLLRKLFGEPESSRLEEIEHANIHELNAWIGRIVTAHSIDEVFSNS